MKQRSFLVLSIVVLFFASCRNKGGTSGVQVPKDAALVVHINSASISSKISWSEISKTAWFLEMRSHTESTDTFAQKLWDDPASTGVDTKKDFVLFVRKQGRGSYVVLEGSLTSEAAYEQLLAEMTKNQSKEIKKAGDFNYMVPDEKKVILWNKTKFAVVTNGNLRGELPGGMMGNRSMDTDEDFAFSPDSLRLFGEQALTMEGGNNLDSDSRFSDLVKNESDVHIWVNAERLAGSNPFKERFAMANTEALMKDNIAAVSLNFDNGKIAVKSKHYYGDELSKIMANNRPSPINAAIINRVPSSNVTALFAFNYSPPAIRDILGLIGMTTMADAFLGRLNFSLDEFIKANKGEVVIAVADLVNSRSDTTKRPRGFFPFSGMGANVLFATSANDTVSFRKMLGAIGGMVGDLKKEKGMAGPDSTSTSIMPGIDYKLQNGWFAVSNSGQFRDNFLAGGNSNLPFVDRITGHAAGFYIDLQKLVNWFHSMKGGGDQPAIDSLNIWQDIVGKGGDFKDKVSEFEVEVNFTDKNTNSLKQLNMFMDKMARMRKDRMDNRPGASTGPMIDSSAIMPRGSN